MAAVYLRDAMSRIDVSARTVLGACAEGGALRANMAVMRKFAKFDPVDAITLRRRIARGLLDAGKFAVMPDSRSSADRSATAMKKACATRRQVKLKHTGFAKTQCF
jgi:hypothetical protein